MALYGAPVWSRSLKKKGRETLHRMQCIMTIRAVRAYRSVSFRAAVALAGMIPLDLQAAAKAKVYRRVWRLKLNGDVQWEEIVNLRKVARNRALRKWKAELEGSGAGRKRMIGAVLANWDQWQGCARRPGLTYRVTQVLTGHGCFGEFLRRIGAEHSAECFECGAEVDSAQHTVEACPAFAEQRSELRRAIGDDLSPAVLIRALITAGRQQKAVITFCEEVMTDKEAKERSRKRIDPARRERRRQAAAGRRVRGPTGSRAS